MTAVQPSKVDMCRLLSDQPVGAIEYIDKEVNVKEFDWDYWQLHRCEKTTLARERAHMKFQNFVRASSIFCINGLFFFLFSLMARL